MKRIILFVSIAILLLGGIFCVRANKLPFAPHTTLNQIREAQRNPDVEAVLESMTLEQKVGQMFMGCFYNETPSADTVNQYNLGSVLLFSASFKNTDRKELSTALHNLNEKCTITPMLAVDEEGGSVCRVSREPAFRKTPFASPRSLFAQGGMEAVIADTHEKNALLKDLGINLNLAPVCDISQDPADFMYDRSLGQDAETTSDYAVKTVEACLADNIGCSLKHFPGYGNAADTHKGLAVDNRSLEQLENNDFLPFEAGINAGAPSVLVSHNIVSALDNDLPASLSPAVHRILREKMNFDGVIITDDLSMGAIADYCPDVDSAVTAVIAGNDMLCTGDFKTQYDALIVALDKGIISEDRIDMSVRKIIKWKIDLGLIDAGDFKEAQ